jgi:hypothetical protein
MIGWLQVGRLDALDVRLARRPCRMAVVEGKRRDLVVRFVAPSRAVGRGAQGVIGHHAQKNEQAPTPPLA